MATSPQHVFRHDDAVSLDAHDPLRHLRPEFHIPSTASLRATSLPDVHTGTVSPAAQSHKSRPSVYLCGNSLGLQPHLTATRIQQYLSTWATQGVFGHFKPLDGSPLPTWLDADVRAAKSIAPLVGALPSEVAVMDTLTANLHFLMAAFYKPDINGRHKVIIESKAFPSDHYAVESQIRHHGLSPSTSLLTISPSSSSSSIPNSSLLSTESILTFLTLHSPTTSILLLPSIQFYTGQSLDIPLITSHAHSLGIFVIWDLAHAIGNIPLQLHDWNVDAAVWCSYKYLNAGPGAIAGLFIHERHTRVAEPLSDNNVNEEGRGYINRLSGWWGSSKSSRFAMTNHFEPTPGAAGFQLSNPCIISLTSLQASLEIFYRAGGMSPLRQKSIKLTAFLENLLIQTSAFQRGDFDIITPREGSERGAQLSLRLSTRKEDREADGKLEKVMRGLEKRGVVVDGRKPDVVRVAPAPLYNSYVDVWDFVSAWEEVLGELREGKMDNGRADGSGLDMTT